REALERDGQVAERLEILEADRLDHCPGSSGVLMRMADEPNATRHALASVRSPVYMDDVQGRAGAPSESPSNSTASIGPSWVARGWGNGQLGDELKPRPQPRSWRHRT